MAIDFRQINRLLKPLGFSLKSICSFIDSSTSWKIYTVNSSLEVDMKLSDQVNCRWEWTSLEDISANLFSKCIVFKIWEGYDYNGETVANPYLGCASLEEAMIKKDLLGNA